jgi:hypothetical protein
VGVVVFSDTPHIPLCKVRLGVAAVRSKWYDGAMHVLSVLAGHPLGTCVVPIPRGTQWPLP